MLLSQIESTLLQGHRISKSQGLQLFKEMPLKDISALANQVTQNRFGPYVTYINNYHINYTNYCQNEAICHFCSFSKSPSQTSFTLEVDQILAKGQEAHSRGAKEIHITGGLHDKLPFSYYTEILSKLSEAFPAIQIKAFTAVEIDHFSKLFQLKHDQILQKLKNSGLKSLTAGGLEIINPQIREKICPSKLSPQKWMEIHQKAHDLKLSSSSSMLFGHFETPEDILDHLQFLRQGQDQSQGFLSFIPLKFHPQGNRLSSLPGVRDNYVLKVFSISRLFLDNYKMIKSYWVSLGLQLAEKTLSSGANDMDGTIVEEKIYHAAGSRTPHILREKEIQNLISQAKKIPKERDSLFNFVKK